MKPCLCLLLYWAASLTVSAADTNAVKFYVQLVHATESATAPQPEARRIGPKLKQLIEAPFRMRYYWEVQRREVLLTQGMKGRVRLSPQREVEIALTPDGKRKVTSFLGGKAAEHATQPVGEHMTILGGDGASRGSWFVVVRRDRPMD